MESNNHNQHIFESIKDRFPVSAALVAIIRLEFGSSRNMARCLKLSHTTVRGVVRGQVRTDIAQDVFKAIGVEDPYC